MKLELFDVFHVDGLVVCIHICIHTYVYAFHMLVGTCVGAATCVCVYLCAKA